MTAASSNAAAVHVAGASRRISGADVVVFALALAVAYALKRHYSTASAEELRWALAPTTALVELLTGVHFEAERGAGFVSESRHLVIAPACAGVNFFVVALLSLVFGFVTDLRSVSSKAVFVVACALAAYLGMVVTNAGRISAGVVLAPHLGILSDACRGEVHRVEGVVIYLTSLWVLSGVLRALLGRVVQ